MKQRFLRTVHLSNSLVASQEWKGTTIESATQCQQGKMTDSRNPSCSACVLTTTRRNEPCSQKQAQWLPQREPSFKRMKNESSHSRNSKFNTQARQRHSVVGKPAQMAASDWSTRARERVTSQARLGPSQAERKSAGFPIQHQVE